MLFPSLTSHDGRVLDQVQLTGMLMSCVIGIFPHERSRKQPVTIDMCLYLDTRKAAQSASIQDTIDYAGAVREIAFILDHCEFQLIETAVEAICRHFLGTYRSDHNLPAVEGLLVRISKPSALTHGIVPAVQILRRRADCEVTACPAGSATLFTIHTAQDSSLHLLVAKDDKPIQLQDILPNAENVLPLGKWSVDNEPVKSRSPVALSTEKQQIFCSPSNSPHASRILMIQSRPQIG